jgi:hypothetical protein
MAFLKLILAFAPWLAFLVIAHDSVFRLKLGLVVALVLSIVMGVTGLHRGVILWAGLIFFTCTTVAVVGFDSAWATRYMGVLATGVLTGGVWLTVLLKKPFTMDYAKQHTAPSLWSSPTFLRTNYVLTSVWGVVFAVNFVLAWGKLTHFMLSPDAYEVISYSLMLATAAFTAWYPDHVRKSQERAAPNSAA